ncbi:hypothetical protein V6M85_03105 [Sulfolobus tengchongensis]|uniref:AAA+ ATPase domain-containing protein n=1 Tax=Sulfolobus tengchongensis TaxID=207809 RepID=A0AAX4L3V5_9CREN
MVVRVYEDLLLSSTSKKDFIVVSGLPRVGKTTLINKIKGDFITIQLPNEVNTLEELVNYRKLISSLKKENKRLVVEGRNYVIQLLLGKVSLSETPNLENPDTKLRGSALTYELEDLPLPEDIKDEELIKILEYSLVTLPGYSTFIPKLYDEAFTLYKENRLDEALQAVIRVKKLYSNFPTNKDIKGNDAIIYPLLSLFSSKEELKYAWSLLSDTWRELVFYRIDSALHLLPGTARKVITEFLSGIKSETKIQKPIEIKVNFTIRYFKKIESLVTDIINGKSGLIVGELGSGKTTLAKQVADYISTYYSYNVVYFNQNEENQQYPQNTLMIIDYHGENYLPLRKILKAKDIQVPKLFVLTDELAHVLNLKNVSAIVRRTPILEIPPTDEKFDPNAIIEKMDKQINDYVYNVIFEGDPNVIRWYAPVIKMVLKYGNHLPVKYSKMVLEANGRTNVDENDPILLWFSYTDKVNEKLMNYGVKDEIDKDFVDPIVDYENEIFKKIKEEQRKLLKEFLNVIIYVYTRDIESYWMIDELRDYFMVGRNVTSLGKKVIRDLIPRMKELIAKESCVKNIESHYEILVKKNYRDVNDYLHSSVSWMTKEHKIYENIIKTLFKPKDMECLRNAFKAIWVDLTVNDESRLFFALRPYMVEKIKEYKDDDLVYLYLSMCSFTNTRKYLREILSSDKWSIFNYVFFPKKDVTLRDPLIFFANTLGWTLKLSKYLSEGKYEALVDSIADYEKRVAMLKSVMGKVDKEKAKLLTRVALGKDEDPMEQINLYLEQFKFEVGLVYYHNYNFSINFKEYINLIDKLMTPWYNTLLKYKNNWEVDEIIDVFRYYQVKLAKSLVYGGKYEYKTILNDIIELAKTSDLQELDLAKDIAEVALGIKKEISDNNSFYAILANLISNDDLQGINKLYEEFNRLENLKVRTTSDRHKLLKLLVGYFINNNKKNMEDIIKEMGDDNVHAGIAVTSSVINYKPKLIASLILYIDLQELSFSFS